MERLFLNRYSFDLLFFSFIKKVVDCYKTVADWFVPKVVSLESQAASKDKQLFKCSHVPGV